MNGLEERSGCPARDLCRSDVRILADLFGMLERYPDRRFAAYGAASAHIQEMRERFAQWREELTADLP
ncbi:hypothetical protein ACLQ26_17800 [Micromonospora sp. DT43]|uniref:hypothetical protein n=1 Tax=Micromonospora sp. DT43 TaxID=3393440 RepID=UPI003CED9D20